jgi:hypothetical protein
VEYLYAIFIDDSHDEVIYSDAPDGQWRDESPVAIPHNLPAISGKLTAKEYCVKFCMSLTSVLGGL